MIGYFYITPQYFQNMRIADFDSEEILVFTYFYLKVRKMFKDSYVL